MSAHIYVDETKARGYLLVAASLGEQRHVAKRELSNLILPGQRSLHMKDERDQRKRQIADTIVRLGVQVTIYDAGRAQAERERRARCLQALIDDAAGCAPARIVFDLDETARSWDRQKIVELTRVKRLGERVTYAHAARHQEPLLAIPDAVAWCWARGGAWRQRVAPVVAVIREV